MKNTGTRLERSAGISLLLASLLAGCATQQQTGALLGAGGATVACSLAYPNEVKKRNICILAAGSVAAFAGSEIGRALDERDRKLAEEASRRAISEREQAVQNAMRQRNEEIQRQQNAELARARSRAEREEASRRAMEAQQTAQRDVEDRVHRTGSSTAEWQSPSGNRGTAQVVGPVAIEGRTGCQNVREIAYVRGQEITQRATYCPRADGGGLERVS